MGNVEYMGDKCEFCEGLFCDRVYYKNALDGILAEVAVMNCKLYQIRFTMYKRFTFMKYGVLGSELRCRVNECVQELIVLNFPVEAGKRKRSYNFLSNEPENHD